MYSSTSTDGTDRPKIPRAAKWQEVKDITNMYSGNHVRIADIIEADLNTPDHRIGYAFIVEYAYADKAFGMSNDAHAYSL